MSGGHLPAPRDGSLRASLPAPSRLAPDRAGDAPDEEPGDDVQDDRHDQEDQAKGDEARLRKTDARLAERRGDLRGDGLGLVEQTAGDGVAVADDHRDRHRLAQRSAEPEDDRADDAGPGVRYDGPGDDLPARRPEREHRLTLTAWYGPDDLA